MTNQGQTVLMPADVWITGTSWLPRSMGNGCAWSAGMPHQTAMRLPGTASQHPWCRNVNCLLINQQIQKRTPSGRPWLLISGWMKVSSTSSRSSKIPVLTPGAVWITAIFWLQKWMGNGHLWTAGTQRLTATRLPDMVSRPQLCLNVQLGVAMRRIARGWVRRWRLLSKMSITRIEPSFHLEAVSSRPGASRMWEPAPGILSTSLYLTVVMQWMGPDPCS